MADDWAPRTVDLAHVNGRGFTFSAGYGLDASVVRRVDAHPRLKARLKQWYFAYAAVATFTREYVVRPPRLEAHVGDQVLRGVTALVQNGDPYTYFGTRPVHVAEGLALDDGRIGGVMLERAAPIDIPTVTRTPALRSAAPGAPQARSAPSRPPTSCASSRPTGAPWRCRSTATTSATPSRPSSASGPGR